MSWVGLMWILYVSFVACAIDIMLINILNMVRRL